MTPIVHYFVTEEDYPELRRISQDGESLPATYEMFSQKVGDYLQSVRDQGGVAIKVYIEPDGLLQWCRARGCDIDADSRTLYAASCFRESERDNSGH